MTKAAPFAQTDGGQYITGALSERDFMRVFNVIAKEQSNNRQNAQNTLVPKRLSRRSVEDLVKIGRRKDGTPFTESDLKRFAEMRDKYRKRRSNEQGILYAELIANARDVDIQRASGRSKDGRAIYSARFAKLERANVVNYRVKASGASVHEEHRVRMRIEGWEEELERSDGKDYKLPVKRALKGHFSIECDCGRHQYWYRYMATIGGYQLGRPREMSFPKVRNPNLKGTACKHVLLVAKKLQSPSEQARLARQMEKQAIQIGFTDSGKGSTYTARKNEKVSERGAEITERQQEQAKAEYQKYLQRKNALSKKVKSNSAATKSQHEKIKRLKAQVDKSKAREQKLKSQVNALKNAQKRRIKEQISKQAKAVIDVAKSMGATEEQAIKSFSKQSGISEQAIKKALE